jgi:hypothetical protein
MTYVGKVGELVFICLFGCIRLEKRVDVMKHFKGDARYKFWELLGELLNWRYKYFNFHLT